MTATYNDPTVAYSSSLFDYAGTGQEVAGIVVATFSAAQTVVGDEESVHNVTASES